MKKIIRKVHLWLGLVSGLLVFIISVTGALYAFQEEIQDITDDWRYAAVQAKPVLLPSQIKSIAEEALPGKQLHSINYLEPGKSIEVTYYHFEPTYYYNGYFDPYSGELLHIQNMDDGFFNWILKGHMYLWLPIEIGSKIVMVSTLVFAFMVLSGIVLWFPKNRNIFRNRSWFRWKRTTSVKRKTWDMHAVTGFYACVFALIFIITGLVWVLPGFDNALHKLIGGEKSVVYEDAVSKDILSSDKVSNPLDKIYLQTLKEVGKVAMVEVHPPETESSSIMVAANPEDGTYYKTDYRFYDQYTLKELEVDHVWDRYATATNADKILRLNYDIHVGAILGLPGKVLACLLSLLIASLPVTGFIIWRGRRRKNYSTPAAMALKETFSSEYAKQYMQ